MNPFLNCRLMTSVKYKHPGNCYATIIKTQNISISPAGSPVSLYTQSPGLTSTLTAQPREPPVSASLQMNFFFLL